MIHNERFDGILASHTLASIEAESLLDQAEPIFDKEGMQVLSGRDFGRHIEASVEDLKQHGVIRLDVRRQPAAVLLSLDNYDLIVAIAEKLQAFTDELMRSEVARAGNDFDALFRKFTAKESAVAADALFSASGDDLANAFQPGKTEQP